MNTTLAASANSEKVLRKSLKSTHLVTAAYSSVRLTTEHSDVNRWEFYSEHQPINQCRLIFFMPSHPETETKCQHFTGIENVKYLDICETMREKYPGRVKKGWNHSQCKAWWVALKGAQNQSAVKGLLSCPPAPETEHPVIRVRTPYAVQGIRKREPVGGKYQKCKTGLHQNTSAQVWVKFVEAPFVQSLHNFWANRVCNVPFPPLHSFQDVFIFTSFLMPTLMPWDGEEDCNFCGQRAQPP